MIKWLKVFLWVDMIFLIIISILSFFTNNVADAIFFMVVAVFIQNGLREHKRNWLVIKTEKEVDVHDKWGKD